MFNRARYASPTYLLMVLCSTDKLLRRVMVNNRKSLALNGRSVVYRMRVRYAHSYLAPDASKKDDSRTDCMDRFSKAYGTGQLRLCWNRDENPDSLSLNNFHRSPCLYRRSRLPKIGFGQ